MFQNSFIEMTRSICYNAAEVIRAFAVFRLRAPGRVLPSIEGFLSGILHKPVFTTPRTFFHIIRYVPFTASVVLILQTLSGIMQGVTFLVLVPVLRLSFRDSSSSMVDKFFNRIFGLFSTDVSEQIFLGVALFAGFGILSVIVNYFSQIKMVEFNNRIDRLLKEKITNTALSIRWETLQSLRLGEISQSLMGDSFRYALGAERLISGMGKALCGLMLVLVGFTLVPGPALFIFTSLLLMTIGYHLFYQKKRDRPIEIVTLTNQASALTTEALNNIQYIRSTGVENVIAKKLGVFYSELFSKLLRFYRQLRLGQATFEIGIILCIALFLSFIAVWDGERIAEYIVFLGIFFRATPYFLSAQLLYHGAKECQFSAESWLRQFERLTQRPKVKFGDRAPKFITSIAMNSVSYKHDEGKDAPQALSDISWSLPYKNALGIIGESGSGKSTVIDLLTGLRVPQKGEVLVDGIPISECDIEAWQCGIGLILQKVQLFRGSILDNIAFGDPEPDREFAELCAEEACALSFIKELPHRMDTKLGEQNLGLSGGQCQRIAIARALYRKPHLILLDEPTSSLDADSERVVIEAVRRLKGKTTIVIVSHKIANLSFTDEIVVLDKGKIVKRGHFDSVIQSNLSAS